MIVQNGFDVAEKTEVILVRKVGIYPQQGNRRLPYKMPPYMPKSKSDKWATPSAFYKTLDDEFHFNYDPCPIEWKPEDPDGLTTEWGTSTFVNPPYSKVAKWIEKAHQEWKKGKTVVMLINAITDTIAFHKYIYNQAEVRFVKGRICFIDPQNPSKKQPSPKPSMIVVFKKMELGSPSKIDLTR
jgi:site-specific DNA-methyltransferase (adenine-specific)